MVPPIYHDAWRAILQYCHNVELAGLWLTGDRTIQYLLKTSHSLLGKGYYFPLLQEFRELKQLDLVQDTVIIPQAIPFLKNLHTLIIRVTAENSIDTAALPETLTHLGLTMCMKRNREQSKKGEIDLATLPQRLGSLTIHLESPSSNFYLTWSKVGDQVLPYRELATIKITKFNGNGSAIQALLTNTVALTDLTIKYIGGDLMVPNVATLQQVKKVHLEGLPYSQMSVDHLQLFPNAEVSVFFSPHGQNTDVILDPLSHSIRSLQINHPLNVGDLQNFERFNKLQELAIVTKEFDIILDHILPQLHTLTVMSYGSHKLAVPASLTSLRWLGSFGIGVAREPQYIIHPDCRFRSIDGISLDVLGSLSTEQLTPLEKLSCRMDMGTLEIFHSTMVKLVNLVSLRITFNINLGKDAKDHTHYPLVGVLSLLSSLKHLTKLDINVAVYRNTDLGILIFPDTVTDLSLNCYEDYTGGGSPDSFALRLTVGSFPLSLVKLHLNSIGITLDNLMLLQRCRNITELTVRDFFGTQIEIEHFKQLLVVLPTTLTRVQINTTKQKTCRSGPAPEILSAVLQQRKRFLTYVQCNDWVSTW